MISKPPEPPCRIIRCVLRQPEQKDLELLAKGVETGFSGSDVRLTKEEEEQIAKIKAAGLTEYQQQSLALKKSEESYVNELADARNEIQTENAVIRQTKIERLKSNSMELHLSRQMQ